MIYDCHGHLLKVEYHSILRNNVLLHSVKEAIEKTTGGLISTLEGFIHSSDETRCVDEAIDESLLHSVKAS